MLKNYTCINQNPLTIEKYMEMIYRWSFFFKGEQTPQLIQAVFLSDKTIYNSNVLVVKSACQILNRICIKQLQEIILIDKGQQEIISSLMKAVSNLQGNLNNSDMQSEKIITESLSSLYGLIGHFVGHKS